MNKYGQAAIKAIKLIKTDSAATPLEAWNRSTIDIFGQGTSSQKKGCPKNAFLCLCEAGLIRGVPQGAYAERSGSQLNKEYAKRAVELLKGNPAFANDKKALWEAVMSGEGKQHNSQMDVVVALWESGYIGNVY